MNAELQDNRPTQALNLPDGLPPPRRYVAVAAVSLGTFVTAVDGAIVNVALPTIARDLQVQPSTAVMMITAYQLVLMMTVLPFSALGQRLGHRATFQCGLTIYVAATIACFVARSLPWLVVVRALQALGLAAVLSVVAALIRSIYPLPRLGRGLSFNTMIATAAASIAPTVGGALLAVASWPWLFAVIAPFGVAAILLGRKALPEGQRRNEPFDVLGATMCAATFGLAIVGLESVVHGGSALIAAALIVLSIGLGVVFVRRELRQAQPVLPVDLLRVKNIALPCLGSLAAYIAITIMMVSLPFRLQQQFSFTPAAAGAALTPLPLVTMIVAPASGLLSDRIPAGLLGGIGMMIGFAGMLCVGFLPDAPQQLDVLWRVAICGLGFGMFFSPNARQIVGTAPPSRAAAAGALFSTIRGAGQTLGATAIAALLALGIGTDPTPGVVAAALALIAGVCSFAALRSE